MALISIAEIPSIASNFLATCQFSFFEFLTACNITKALCIQAMFLTFSAYKGKFCLYQLNNIGVNRHKESEKFQFCFPFSLCM